jgi:predicted CoA-binding protein
MPSSKSIRKMMFTLQDFSRFVDVMEVGITIKAMNELEILKSARTVAVLGFSPDPYKTSYHAASHLIDHGYEVYLVNPNHAGKESLGLTILSSLSEITVHIDVIDVFRKSESIPEITDEMIAAKPGTVWFQLGISSPESEEKIRNVGINVVSNRCVMEVLR